MRSLRNGTGLVFAAGALAFSIAVATAQEAAVEEAKIVDGVLQPLSDGFPSQPLTIIVVDDVGSTDSVYASQLAEAAQAMSPVPVNVEHRQDFSNYGTWEALAWLIDQGQEGNDGTISFIYTVPGAVIDLLVIDMKTEVGVDLNDLNVVASTEQLPYFLHQRADAPWGDTLESFVSYAKEHPGEIRYISGGIGSGQDATMQWYLRKFGITVNTIIGGGAGERALTVASGEGDVTVSPPDVILPHFEAGKVEVLMVSGSNPSPAPWDQAPNSASQGIENDPWGVTRGAAVSPKTPESHRKWLETLLTTAAQSPDYVAKRERIPGLTPRILDGEQTRAIAQKAYDETLPIMQELGAYWGDKPK